MPLKACSFIFHNECLSPTTQDQLWLSFRLVSKWVSTLFSRASLYVNLKSTEIEWSLIFNQLGCKLDVEVHFQSRFGSRVASTHGEVHLRFEDDSALSGRARVFLLWNTFSFERLISNILILDFGIEVTSIPEFSLIVTSIWDERITLSTFCAQAVLRDIAVKVFMSNAALNVSCLNSSEILLISQTI